MWLKILKKKRRHDSCQNKLQNFKPPKYNPSKNKRKALQELQSDTLVEILRASKARSTVVLKRDDYLAKYMYHVNNGLHPLLKKDLKSKIKAKTLKQLKVLKGNGFIDNNNYIII